MTVEPECEQSVTAPQDFQFPEAYVIVQPDADILDGHVSLYKGKSCWTEPTG